MRARLQEEIRRLLVSGYGEAPPEVDDSIPGDAQGGFDDTFALPPAGRVVASARPWPSPHDLVVAMASLIGIGEDPPGSNCNALTRWYGRGCVPWAAIALSRACLEAGFSDGAGHWAMPGIRPRTRRGFASVPDLRASFQAAGRFDQTPRRGDLAIVGDGCHACMIESVRADGILGTIEGDYHDDCRRNARTMASITGFCHPTAWGLEPWPGRYLEMGSQGDDVRTFQRRLAERGWRIPVDGVYGPETQRVVDLFQHQKHLDNDGIVGPATWEAAWRAVVT